ncbi:uncharacterized protein N7459_008107 [Penicillium hispanicum]|uniref:uncharacterized protein n=1 Tax=Penicillium hispanicum TaxID=1080232 RepID=UPI002541083D|nr:uncharacterized protein N7459_008107 [Penicillium hispanicum]KAJ5573680.1 hypothetical protein N7459_008107 [Penicillium hispanicum]
MSRRAPPREYYEEDDFEYERVRDRYPRSRRRDREFDEDVEYRRRRSMPPVEDLERLRIRERPPREFVREGVAPPRERGPMGMGRSREDLDEVLPEHEVEEVYMRPRPRRRSHRPREVDEEDLIVDERAVRGGRRHRPREVDDEDLILDKREIRGGRRPRPREVEDELIVDEREVRDERRHRPREVEEEELIFDEKERRGGRRHRPREVDEEELIFDKREAHGGRRRPHELDEEELFIDERGQDRSGGRRHRPDRDFEEDDMFVRRKERAPRRPYDSEGDLRLRDRRFEDDRDEAYYRSSESRRRSRRREAEPDGVIIDNRKDRRRRGKHRGERRSEEEEWVMQWKDRPSPVELEEESDEVRFHEARRHGRRSPTQPRFVREPPEASPLDREEEETDEEIRVRSRMRSKPRHREAEEDEEIVIQKEKLERDRRRGSTDSDEIVVRKSKRRSPPREESLSPEPIRAPPIHQDVITHHRHIDHGFDTAPPPRASSSEISSTRTSIDEVDVHHRSQKGGRGSEQEVSFELQDEESISPTSGPSVDFHNPWGRDEALSRHRRRSMGDERETLVAHNSHSRGRGLPRELDIDEKLSIHEKRSGRRSHAGDDTKDVTDEWSVVHAPSKAEAIEMTGALDIVEVAPKDASEDEVEVIEEEHEGHARPQVSKERRDERWTEITKDLVVREAIEHIGYEFEETRMYYYIFSYLEPGEIDELIELSDEIRQARRRRIREMHRERASVPPRRMSLVDRLPPRPRLGGERRIREREWLV